MATGLCKMLQVPLGSVSHTPHFVCSLHRFCTLPLPMQTTKALFPFSPTHTTVATTVINCGKHIEFPHSVVSTEILCWHCWFGPPQGSNFYSASCTEFHQQLLLDLVDSTSLVLSNIFMVAQVKGVSQLFNFRGRKKGK